MCELTYSKIRGWFGGRLKHGHSNGKNILFEASNMFHPLSVYKYSIQLEILDSLGYNIDALVSKKNTAAYTIMCVFSKNIYLFNTFTSFFVHAYGVLLLHIKYFTSILSVEKIFNLTINGIYIGDLIYDEYIRYTNKHTAEVVDFKLFMKISEAYYFISFYKSILKCEYEYILINHHCYIKQGVLSRMATASNKRVIMTTGFEMKKLHIDDHLFSYLDAINAKYINSILDTRHHLTHLEDTAEQTLLGYENYKIHTENQEELDLLISKIKNVTEIGKKVVFLFAHSFSDNITGNDGRRQAYKDYYTWLRETIKLCSTNNNIHLFVKAHPFEKIYGSSICAKDVFDEAIELGFNNIEFVGGTLSVEPIHTLMDVILTVRGTCRIEYPCFGVPVVCASKSLEINTNIPWLYECMTEQKYKEVLSKLHLLPKMTDEQILQAKYYKYIYHKAGLWGYELDDEHCKLKRVDVEKEDKNFLEFHKKVFTKEDVSISDYFLDNYEEKMIDKLEYFYSNCYEHYKADFMKFLESDAVTLGEIQLDRELSKGSTD